MAHAYTPGLRVAESVVIKKVRRLPLKGTVVVNTGDPVAWDQEVASTFLPGNVQLVNVANRLSVEPGELAELMVLAEGSQIKKGQLLAQSKGFFGMFKSSCYSPADGTVEQISSITGQVVVREPAVPVSINAYIDGTIDEVIPEEGVVVKAQCSFIQGIFGIGGETSGALKILTDDPARPLQESHLDESCRDRIVVGGAYVTNAVLQRAINLGVRGIIVGGIDDQDLREFLGYDLGVAITGSEDKGVTLVCTEGFGAIRMADRTFKLLCAQEGKRASINGATQIRAGVIRPEIIVPLEAGTALVAETADPVGMVEGCPVRVIRNPYFGRLGTVVKLPVELTALETEAKVRVVTIKFDDDNVVVTLPRANVELIEE